MTSRIAITRWEGDLMRGKGQVEFASSHAGNFDVSFPTRSGNPEGQTSPEELIAAAHSSCLAMNLSGTLAAENLIAKSIEITAEATLGPDPQGGFAITGIAITLRADIEGIDADKFATLAKTAELTCPVTKALAGTTITMDAALV